MSDAFVHTVGTGGTEGGRFIFKITDVLCVCVHECMCPISSAKHTVCCRNGHRFYKRFLFITKASHRHFRQLVSQTYRDAFQFCRNIVSTNTTLYYSNN